MNWISVILAVDAGSVEALSDALLETGAQSVDVTDADAGTLHEHAVFGEPAASGAPSWDRSIVRALYKSSDDYAASVADALRRSGLDPACSYKIEHVAEQDWVVATHDQFQPVCISKRLWVVPTWHTPPDPAAVNLSIDPGLAFGTGTHPTTRLCLNWLDTNLRGGERVLDYGCGSGILAIAAMKLGAARSTGVDIDPAALLVARQNAMQNRVEVRFERMDETVPADYDIVLANILANPLILLAPLLARAARAGGQVVLSGILEQQAEDVRDAYMSWFDMTTEQSNDGWVMLSGVRK